MSYQKINFRATSGFVTDGAGEYGETSLSVNYPTTSPQGKNVGWETLGGLPASRDRNSSNPPQLAGFHFDDGPTASTYRVDVSAGATYPISLALGDANAAQACHLEIFDGATSLGVAINATTSGAQRFFDATGTEYTDATWTGSNSPVNKTFSSGIARFKRGTNNTISPLAHIGIGDAIGAAADQPPADAWDSAFDAALDDAEIWQQLDATPFTADVPPADAWDWNEEASADPLEWYFDAIPNASNVNPCPPDEWQAVFDDAGDDLEPWILDTFAPVGADVAAVAPQPAADAWPWDDDAAADDIFADDSEPVPPNAGAVADQPPADVWDWNEDTGADEWGADDAETVDSGEIAAAEAWLDAWDDTGADETTPDDSEPVDAGELAPADAWAWDGDETPDEWAPPEALALDAPDALAIADDWADEPVDADDWWNALDYPLQVLAAPGSTEQIVSDWWDEPDPDGVAWWHEAEPPLGADAAPATDYTRAPQGGGGELVNRPGERPPVISGTRSGNINTSRPANRGGRRT